MIDKSKNNIVQVQEGFFKEMGRFVFEQALRLITLILPNFLIYSGGFVFIYFLFSSLLEQK